MADFYKQDEEYDIPSTSNYMKFEDGDNRFRILGSFAEGTAIQGVEYWKTVNGTRKPVRLTKDQQVPDSELELNKYGEREVPRFFWAFPVYNYEAKRIQILELTQKTILNNIKKVIDNPKWGDPREYDFTVTKEKNGDKVVYTVTNDPKEKLDKTVKDQFSAMYINMPALFEGRDPLKPAESE